MTASDTGTPLVDLAADHPGVSDPVYLRRRNEIAQAAVGLRPGDEARPIGYTARRTRRGRRPSMPSASSTAPTPARRSSTASHGSPCRRIVSRSSPTCPGAPVPHRMASRGGPRAGADPRVLRFARRTPLHVHAVRPPPVRSVVHAGARCDHEVVGHCNSLANPQFADLYAAAGAASNRADDDALVRFSKTFWFTLEFGVVWEAGDLKAYGAGLLSSFGEMNAYRNAELRDWDPDAMAETDYDINVYQPCSSQHPTSTPSSTTSSPGSTPSDSAPRIGQGRSMGQPGEDPCRA